MEEERYEVAVHAWSWFDRLYFGVFTLFAAFSLARVLIPAVYALHLRELAWFPLLLAAGGAALQKWFAKTKPALLRIDAHSIWIDEKRIARTKLVGAVKEAPTGREAPRVRVRLKRLAWTTSFLVENDSAADAILRTLGFVGDATATYVGRRFSAMALGGIFGGATASAVLVALTAFVMASPRDLALLLLAPILSPLILVAAALLVTIFGRMSVNVGSDGIFVRGGFRARFLPVQSLAAVEATRDGAAVLLTSGERIFLRIAVGAGTPAERDDFLRRVRALMTGAATRDATKEATAALVARGNSPRAAWLEALGKVAGGTGDYRLAAVPSEALEAVIADDAADPTARAGAAYVLAKRGEAPRERLRVAASTSASPKVRVALEAAAGDDEAALEEALANVESAAAVRKGR